MNDKQKVHQYPLRLTNEQYRRLKEMGADKSMSAVLIRGLETEWTYYQTVKQLGKKIPVLNSAKDVENFRIKHLKDSPELIVKTVQPFATLNYIQEMKKQRIVKERLINIDETIAYLIRQIGNNINQLARAANAGQPVDRSSLKDFTQSLIKLRHSIEDLNSSKELT